MLFKGRGLSPTNLSVIMSRGRGNLIPFWFGQIAAPLSAVERCLSLSSLLETIPAYPDEASPLESASFQEALMP